MRTSREYILLAGKPYWKRDAAPVRHLLTPHLQGAPAKAKPSMALVPLPAFGRHAGVEGSLLVPRHCIGPGSGPDWERTDWFEAAYWHLSGQAEAAFEKQHGPIHSYSRRLKGWDDRIWKKAWANRIFLFLRAWAAHDAGAEEGPLLGALPKPEIVITHDVDAVEKTLPIRLKQTAFLGFNVLRSLAGRRFSDARDGVNKAADFLFNNEDYWCFERIEALEKKAGASSVFMVHAKDRRSKWPGVRKAAKSWLLDPSYDLEDERLADKLRHLGDHGWEIGLHPGFDCWRDASCLKYERQDLEAVIDAPVTKCRQHWLRFSWAETWKAQEKAGLKLDMTLAFNDRPGFRTGAALRYSPPDPETGKPRAMEVLPTVFMDSHFYDYQPMTAIQRSAAMGQWLEEVRQVRGTAAVIWHQRVFSQDYGWEEGFLELLRIIRKVTGGRR